MDKPNPNREKLVVVSNRLPVVVSRDQGRWSARPGSGGLVTAMAPVLRNRGGVWLGWPGVAVRREARRTGDAPEGDDSQAIRHVLAEASTDVGYRLEPVFLDPTEVDGFYHGFANEILWPLFHGFETRCNFDPAYWEYYVTANARFVEAIRAASLDASFIWVHDYHLMLVAQQLRQAGCRQRLGFFLHIPFPPPDVFFKLPWRTQILEGLVEFDLLGFQTAQDRRNFTYCLRQQLPDLHVAGRGAVVTISHRERSLRAGAFPISVDYRGISRRARSAEVEQAATAFHAQYPGQQVIIGIDRLDYSKGIPERLEAFRLAIKRYPELRKKVVLVQVVVPSRETVPEYERLRGRIEQLVGEINGEFTLAGWVPIHYRHRSFPAAEVFAMLRAADVGLVTPLRDGMNLVAKEYVACAVEQSGVLILSEFAGAAVEFKRGALLVNPYDVEGMAAAIQRAVNMPSEEQRRRMRTMREHLHDFDIFRWVESILGTSFARHLADFQPVEPAALKATR